MRTPFLIINSRCLVMMWYKRHCPTRCSRFLECSMARFTLGLDLGQAQDYSALVIVEHEAAEDVQPERKIPRFDVPHIQRWALGTSYPAIVRDVAAMMQSPA